MFVEAVGLPLGNWAAAHSSSRAALALEEVERHFHAPAFHRRLILFDVRSVGCCFHSPADEVRCGRVAQLAASLLHTAETQINQLVGAAIAGLTEHHE